MQLAELKSLLSRYHIRPDKSMGQNFLLSEKALDEIVAAAELKSDDTVLEIGPGLGILTQRLVEQAGRVIAVEKDRRLAWVLKKMFKGEKNVRIVNDDILFFDSSVILNLIQDPDWIPGQARNDNYFGFKIVANIPYNITGKLLQNFLAPSLPAHDLSPAEYGRPLPSSGESNNVRTRPSVMVLLLQKEVAERVAAKPGEMSLLSVSVQFYADAEIISYVGKESFYPIPEVNSAVVRLRVLDKPRFEIDEPAFFQLVKIGFSNKRKQLQNNLKEYKSSVERHGGPYRDTSDVQRETKPAATPYNIKRIFSSLGLNPLCRAQDLSLEDWEKLYQELQSAEV